MALTFTDIHALLTTGFDTIIDVRSPAEYAEDHIPGAISLPVLDNDERARVGTIYKQQSPFLARKVGAALVARNAAKHLEGPLKDMDGGWKPLVYCWRGGQRSNSFAGILTQVGWRADVVAGGYRTWRRLVVAEVQDVPVRAPVVLLDGNTGSAKTEILARVAARGVQVIDLEGLANHRGSLFGHRQGGQPSQKAFEGRLAIALAGLDPTRPVVVEAESAKIGDLSVPKQMWAAMLGARQRIQIAAPAAARAGYLVRAYGDVTVDQARLSAVIDLLRPVHAREVIEVWLALAAAGDMEPLAADLMRRHYDPRYEKHRARTVRDADVVLETDKLDDAAQELLADQIVALVG